MFYPDWSQPFNLPLAFLIVSGSLLLALREFVPDTRLSYSKFATNIKPGKTISSFYGMLMIYMPSLLVSTFVFVIDVYASLTNRVSVLLFLHYLKRVYEVIFVHKYSGQTNALDCLKISTGYVGYLLAVTYFSCQVPQVSLLSASLGLVLFLSGEYINYYHHRILRNLRKGDSKKYVIPSEGLFQYVWCPHYVGEIITFLAIAIVTQHCMILLLQLGSAGYLAARAYNTREWYKTKFEKIPERACLIPFIF
ncbi:trans-2,3-enoyl-CoA reductase [Helicostylum pulchrum]|nr:trans-2,3-enoyl-CoA reductase [Helicostylum pulchrum]